MQFDARAAKALRVGDVLIIPGAPGLRLEASASRRSWIFRYRSPEGRLRQVKLGEWPLMSAAVAAGKWEEARAQRAAGTDPADARRATKSAPAQPKSAVKVADVLSVFVAHAQASRAAKGASEVGRLFRTMVPETFQRKSPVSVTRADAYDLITSHSATPVVAGNLRRELGAAWELAIDSGRIPESVPNWWRLILRGKLKSAGKIVGGEHRGVVKRVLSVDEVAAILRHLPHLSRLNADLLALYLWTGCRGAELVQIEGRELSQDEAGVLWWTLPKAKVKMERHDLAMDLPIPILGRARDIVLARRDVSGDGYLFPSRPQSKVPHVEQKVVGVAVWFAMPACQVRPEVIRARWPVTDWAPHDLRRTVRTQLSRLGCPGPVAEAVLGHIDTKEDVYDRHDYRAERLEWLTRLVQAWEGACRR